MAFYLATDLAVVDCWVELPHVVAFVRNPHAVGTFVVVLAVGFMGFPLAFIA